MSEILSKEYSRNTKYVLETLSKDSNQNMHFLSDKITSSHIFRSLCRVHFFFDVSLRRADLGFI